MSETFPSIAPLISSLPFTKNNYEFLSVIGIGGSSVVFKVKSLTYDSTFFAAKVTPKSSELNFQDFNALKSLHHPYVIAIYDNFEDDKNIFLILEYCENGSLSSLIKASQIIKIDEMIFYMKKLADALYFCHSKGIAHRDIKPSNVLLDSYGRPKLIDFGISEMLYCNNSNSNEKDGGYYMARKKGEIKTIRKFFGSAPYLAPEIILKESYDPFSADVWSLGVTFYEIVAGKLPWNNRSGKMMEDEICQSSITFPNSVPSSYQKLIILMMQVDQSERPTMKSVAGCSLFQIEIPDTLKLFNQSIHSSSKKDQKDMSNEETSGKKLQKGLPCVTFNNYESFMRNINSHQAPTSSFVLKPSNTKTKRKRHSLLSVNGIISKRSMPCSSRIQAQPKLNSDEF